MRVRKVRLFALLAVVALTALGAAVPARANPDNVIEFIRGYGSDTTYGLMQQMDVLFNGSAGCPNTANGGRADTLTSNPDGSCTPPVPLAARGPENWDHDVAISMYPVGSGNGIVTLEDFGTVDQCGGTASQPYPAGSCGYTAMEYARSSRQRAASPSIEDNLNFVAYAKDAIPWVNWRTGVDTANANFDESTGPAGAVSNLSTTNLQDIFENCTVTLWSQVGGTHSGTPGDRIIIWADQNGSGTRKQFDSFLTGIKNSTKCIPDRYSNGSTTDGERIIFENDASPIVGCTTYAGNSCATGQTVNVNGSPVTEPNLGNQTYLSSIYYFSTGPYAQSPVDTGHANQHGNGADLGSIGGVAPTSSNIENSTFPYNRLLFNVYRNSFSSNNVSTPALDYIGEKGWICKGAKAGSTVDGQTGSALLPDDVAASGDTDSRGGHIQDPLQPAKNYSTEITGDFTATVSYPFDGLIKSQGFVPLSFGPIGGGVTGNSHCRLNLANS